MNKLGRGKESGDTLTMKQALAMIGEGNITIQAMYLAAARGDFPSFRIGKRLLIPKQAFEEFLLGSGCGSKVLQKRLRDDPDYSAFKAYTPQTYEELQIVVDALKRHREGLWRVDRPVLTYNALTDLPFSGSI